MISITVKTTTCNTTGKQFILGALYYMDTTPKKTILIIEDDPAQRVPLAQTLTANGFTVIEAVDGKPGFQKATEFHPDLIILDLIMPEMDGVEFMHLLRNEPWGLQVPVIMFTNVSPDSDKTIQMIGDVKPAYYIVKGELALDDIVRKVREVLEAQ